MRYTLPSGSIILRRRIGTPEWTTFTTTKDAVYDRADIAHSEVDARELVICFSDKNGTRWIIIVKSEDLVMRFGE